ncbi:MAG: oligosaccharide flippase family protein [Candidatus Thermoplasmatota archaeon]
MKSMGASFLQACSRILRVFAGPLHRNTFYIATSKLLNTGAGFVFWVLAARFYQIGEVGIASVMISTLGLVMMFSRFGLDYSVVRFLPCGNKTKVFNTCLWITTLSAFMFAVIGGSLLSLMSSDTTILASFGAIIIFAMIATAESMALVSGNALNGLRKSRAYFLTNAFLMSRILCLFLLVGIGALGIVGSIGIAYAITGILSLIVLSRYLHLKFAIDRAFLRDSFRFSSMNYVANVLFNATTLTLPILVLGMTDETGAAWYFVSFSVAGLLLVVPDSLSMSVLVEGSHGVNLSICAKQAATTAMLVLIPASACFWFFGRNLLALFGNQYVDATELLRILAVTSPLVALYLIYISIQNVRYRVMSLVKTNLARFISIITLSYILVGQMGVIGVGYAWLITHVGLAVLVMSVFRHRI